MITKNANAHKDMVDGSAPSAPPVREPILAHEPPARQERRSSDRVADDQKSGHGSQSALSKMQMMERRKSLVSSHRSDPSE